MVVFSFVGKMSPFLITLFLKFITLLYELASLEGQLLEVGNDASCCSRIKSLEAK